MRDAIRSIFRSNLAIEDGERVLLVTDGGKHAIARQFLDVARELGYAAELVTVPIPEVHGVEPPGSVARKMLAADVIFIITTKSLSHTLARAKATEKGARIATMAGVTEDILRRFSAVDLLAMKARTNRLADILDQGSRGEAFIAPVEDSVNGKLVIDASIAGIGLVDRDATFEIEAGKVAGVEGGRTARRFEALLDDSAKRQVAEFGIGTNDKARITGITIEDEKALGTCHIAFGNNRFFGGTNAVDFHMDCVMRAPIIVIDDRIVMGG
jgi:leucyl aminopeptidase (aminopeptidase T)